MKKLLLVCLSALIIGCDPPVKTNGFVDGYRVIEIDSCEYLLKSDLGGYSFFTHKGNCKYCTERRKEEFYKMLDVLFNTDN